MSVLQAQVNPPLDGSIPALPGFLDFHAKHNASLPAWVLPNLDPASYDYVTVTWREFADATHRIAHAIRPGRAGPDRAVVAVFVNCDTLLYHALTVGIVRAGLVPFPLSPRNSASGVASMLVGTDCHKIISQASFAPLIKSVRAALPADYALEVDDLPALSDVFPQFIPPLPVSSPPEYPPSQPSGPSDIVLYLHSSGSTGFPKPISQTVTTILHWCRSAPLVESRDRGYRWASVALPPFHTMGMMMQLYQTLVGSQPVALYHPRAHLGMPPTVPTPDNVIDAARRTKCDVVPCVPAFIEAWAHNDEYVEFLASTKGVAYAGGPLSEKNGTKLTNAGVDLVCIYGGTEFGVPSACFDLELGAKNNPAGKTREDWQWMQFTDRVKVRWEPQGDGSYECVLLTCPTNQPSKENLPNGEKGYATSDLWGPHPTKSGLWRIVGRVDDVIVLSNGEKIVPLQQEGHIAAHPWVKGALMFGRGREQPGVIVELHEQHVFMPDDEAALVKLRNALWPQVDEANRTAPAFGRVFKEMIIVSDPRRPFPRAAKGTILRKQAITLYEHDIEAFLNATFLRNRIIGALRSSTSPAIAQLVSPNFIFVYPTIRDLAKAIVELVQSGKTGIPESGAPVADIEALIKKYTAMLPQGPVTPHPPSGEVVILITGTTGILGTHIIVDLLRIKSIKHIYAINRGPDVRERQLNALDAACLPKDIIDDPRLSLLAGDLNHENLGLDVVILKAIQNSVTHVLHNAWRVDFNLALASFESQISATTRLLSLFPSARFFFSSSVSAAQAWRTQHTGRVPEAPLTDSAVALGPGYGASKYVVENILANARKAGMKTTSLRIGQLSGSATYGVWRTTEWYPSLIKSSIALGGFPKMSGLVSWIAMDHAAAAMCDIILGTYDVPLVNLLHPRPIETDEVMTMVHTELGLDVPFVAWEAWVEKLKKAAEHVSSQDLQDMPALKLLDFYEGLLVLEKQTNTAGSYDVEIGGLPLFETQHAEKASATIANLPRLGKNEVKAWMRYWRSRDFFP
ncbi:hypothetical protein IEO21_06834 [Rhodonia placenta]|uniref:Acetyl-CoA synthetase-like protein n=1 Tax=Rhodonia placenta TaxID=104341 RepID=A0A8H7U0Q5_9APHY|nr:hypothetical protein IEO21_06834 [Postia placenta]